MRVPASPRRRNAEATRDAILQSARTAFACAGYDGAGVREIAEGAGVTAMLVNRYFGSKEQLFAEVVAASMATPSILVPEVLDAPNVGERIATILVAITKAGDPALEGFQIMLRSASSERAAEIAREEIEKHHHRTMTGALDGARKAERAALILAIVAGVQVMRQMIGLAALANAKPVALIKILAPIFQQLIEGEAQVDR